MKNDWVVLETSAFKTIFGLLQKAQTNSFMYSIVGPTGCGKTQTINSYKQIHNNVYYFKVEKTHNAKDLYLNILSALGIFDYDHNLKLGSIADRASYLLNSRKEKILLIFDEAGKFSADMMEYFQTIRDKTEAHVGIVLLGTLKFKSDIDSWVLKGYKGIPELNSRIFSWTILDVPTETEKYQIVKQNGITDPSMIRKIVKESSDLRKVYQNVMEYRYSNLKQYSKDELHSE